MCPVLYLPVPCPFIQRREVCEVATDSLLSCESAKRFDTHLMLAGLLSHLERQRLQSRTDPRNSLELSGAGIPYGILGYRL